MDYFWIARRGCNFSTPQIYWDTKTLQCYDDCGAAPVSTFNTTPGYFCKGCDISCYQCSGSLPGNCTSCVSWYFRVPSGNFCLCKTGYIDIGVSLCYPC